MELFNQRHDWINERILNWITELNLPIVNLGWEFIIQKYPKGFEFKPHIDDVAKGDGTEIAENDIIQFYHEASSTDEYSGGVVYG